MAKKIGIISDTHGLLRPEVLEILKTCDCILHAGDVDRPEIGSYQSAGGASPRSGETMTETGHGELQLHSGLR